MGKHSTCLIIDFGETYNTIHEVDEWYSMFSKKWGEEFSSYFSAKIDGVELPNLTVCTLINMLENYKYCLVSDGKDYTIIHGKGILVEGEDDKMEFFKAIFELVPFD
jgi:hypothetical protein